MRRFKVTVAWIRSLPRRLLDSDKIISFGRFVCDCNQGRAAPF
jgi:hypothetical protein